MLLSLTAEEFFGVLLLAVGMQLIAGVVMCFDAQKRVFGQAMLASIGILLVVGFSFCTILLVNG
ncbi:hypothetical protein [Pedobacter sp. SYP-B3415]|uniref:hypothetical protein n=1 Tax=Pedobacter sp. SYP-B3415 TaxID=2496641 RepID=UPI00101C276F|nr:hypothetical protein [Pedobacter sp. SYP-B3415]